jgi:hypothetical protein
MIKKKSNQDTLSFDDIFSESIPHASGSILEKFERKIYTIPKGPSTFNCHKSFQESRIYTSSKNIVEYSIIYRSAKLSFPADMAPTQSASGNFEDIDIGSDFVYDDPWVDGFSLEIDEPLEKLKIEKILQQKNWEQKLVKLGFVESVRYDIILDDMTGSSVHIECAN